MKCKDGCLCCQCDHAGAVADRVPGGVEPTAKLLVKGGVEGRVGN